MKAAATLDVRNLSHDTALQLANACKQNELQIWSNMKYVVDTAFQTHDIPIICLQCKSQFITMHL